MTRYLISYQCRNKNNGSISYGMAIVESVLPFLRLTKDVHNEQYVILNVSPLTEEEVAEISDKGLLL